MPEPHGFCSLFCCPVWPAAVFLTSHWCIKSFGLRVNSLAEQVVSFFLMRAVLDNCLFSAKHSGFCSASSCEHQGNKFSLCVCLDCIFFFCRFSIVWGSRRTWLD